MHCRKLHTDEADREKLHNALKELYADGVRIPVGKPYELRMKIAAAAAAAAARDNDDNNAEQTGGLELAPEDTPNPDAHTNPYKTI